MRRRALILTAVVVALLATGCTVAPSPRESSPSPSGSASASASPSVSASASANEETGPATWIVSNAGIGPLEIGMPYVEAFALLSPAPTGDFDRCAQAAFWRPPAFEGADAIITRSFEGDDQSPLEIVSWNVWDSARAATAPPGPRTATGIGIGSTPDEVRVAYPDAVEVTRNGLYLQAGRLYFAVGQGIVTEVGVTATEVPWEFCG